jgi:hypothetical protein
MKKTDDELLDDIRQAALAIREASDEIPLVGSMTIAEIQRLESYGNALAIYAKLLRQRLEAGQTTQQEGGTWPNAMPIHVTLKLSDVTQREGE